MPENKRQCDSTGYHGAHPHALWAILAQGLQPSGPQVPGSRFFEVTSADGSTRAVAGIYLFKADRCQKCLFYAPAVLLDAVMKLQKPHGIASDILRCKEDKFAQRTRLIKTGSALTPFVIADVIKFAGARCHSWV